ERKSNMAKFTLTVHVDAPREKVFQIFSDFENAAERISGISKLDILTDGPVGVGTRFRETRVMFNKEATEEMEITQLTTGESYTVICESCGCHYESIFRFEPDGERTHVAMEFNAKPLTLFAKLTSPIAGLLFGSMMRKCMLKDLEDLKAFAEGKPAPAAT
ncbi:MAG: SRPBCC family protein, partial [Phycisphaerae bacterium]